MERIGNRNVKYYADEESRRMWLADFPDHEMPPAEEPPYDRDRRLPQWPCYQTTSSSAGDLSKDRRVH